MISLNDARSAVTLHVSQSGAATTPLAHARGRVLREDVFASEDFPAFDRSAMDGYAVAAANGSDRFTVVGEIRAGELPTLILKPGECVRIFTGARMPDGGTQVLMQEKVSREGDEVVVLEREAALHVRVRGEDARTGALLLRAGTRLWGPELALLAQVGAVLPLTSLVPRAVHLVSGDELVPPSANPGPSQIRDSNSTLVACLLEDAGARLAHQRHCADSVDAIVREVHSMPEAGWDVLLISGGASVGDYDFGAKALIRLGFQLHFQAVNLRPGKPLVFGTRGHHVAFVVPGNPASHFVVFQTIIRHAFGCLEGAPASWPLVELPLDGELPRAVGGRETYLPAQVFIRNAQMLVRLLSWKSSGDLVGLASANALVQVLAESAPVHAGGVVKCLLLDQR